MCFFSGGLLVGGLLVSAARLVSDMSDRRGQRRVVSGPKVFRDLIWPVKVVSKQHGYDLRCLVARLCQESSLVMLREQGLRVEAALPLCDRQKVHVAEVVPGARVLGWPHGYGSAT